MSSSVSQKQMVILFLSINCFEKVLLGKVKGGALMYALHIQLRSAQRVFVDSTCYG